MQTQIVDQSQTREQPVDPVVSGTVRPVGTFACGQSEHGCLQVSADAGLDSFASGLVADRPSETA